VSFLLYSVTHVFFFFLAPFFDALCRSKLLFDDVKFALVSLKINNSSTPINLFSKRQSKREGENDCKTETRFPWHGGIFYHKLYNQYLSCSLQMLLNNPIFEKVSHIGIKQSIIFRKLRGNGFTGREIKPTLLVGWLPVVGANSSFINHQETKNKTSF
jgi:hypothetical protein